MEFFNDTHFAIPASQIVVMLFISSVALLYGRTKLALLVNFAFALHWGYLSNSEILFNAINNFETFTLIYFGIGIGSALLVIVIFIFDSRN